MCSVSVVCPLCNQTKFSSIDALRSNLIKAANGPLPCPICNELFLGLDKLTIHLFSHNNLIETEDRLSETPTVLPSPAATAKVNEQDLKLNEEEKLQALAGEKLKRIYLKKRMKKFKENSTTSSNTNTTNIATSPSKRSDCDICELSFSNEQLKTLHMNLVHQNLTTDVLAMNQSSPGAPSTVEPFKCHLCSKTFKYKGSLRVHLKVVHTLGLPSYTAKKDKANTQHRLLSRLPQPHSDTSSLSVSLSSLASNNSVSGPNLGPVASPSGFTFGTLTLLPKAASSPHCNTPAVASLQEATKSPQNILNINSNGDLVHSNDLATLPPNVLLVFNANTAGLMNTNTPQTQPNLAAVPANVVNGQFELEASNNGRTNGASDANPKIWECDICAKNFTTKYFLKKHKRLHTGEMPYTCEICSRTFTFQQSYHKHLLYHSEIKPHVCTTCGRAFKELSTLHNHERIHSGEKPFKCEVCGKSFRQRVSFLVHTRIHTGVMPYKCEVCQKAFRYKVSQRTHKCTASAVEPEQNPERVLESSLIISTSGNLTSRPLEDDAVDLSESFIKNFLDQQLPPPASASQNDEVAQSSPASLEIANINDEQHLSLVKAIDDYVSETCTDLYSLHKPSEENVEQTTSTAASAASFFPNLSPENTNSTSANNFVSLQMNEGSNSPSQQLQRMRLYSPHICGEMPSNDNDNDSSFESFLFTNVGGNTLL